MTSPKLTANIILSGEKLKAFPARSRIGQGSLIQPLFFKVLLEVIDTATRQEMKGIQIGKGNVKLSLIADDIVFHRKSQGHYQKTTRTQ